MSPPYLNLGVTTACWCGDYTSTSSVVLARFVLCWIRWIDLARRPVRTVFPSPYWPVFSYKLQYIVGSGLAGWITFILGMKWVFKNQDLQMFAVSFFKRFPDVFAFCITFWKNIAITANFTYSTLHVWQNVANLSICGEIVTCREK